MRRETTGNLVTGILNSGKSTRGVTLLASALWLISRKTTLSLENPKGGNVNSVTLTTEDSQQARWTFGLNGDHATEPIKNKPTVPDVDCILVLKDNKTNKVLLRMPVIVVIPKAISKTHPQADEIVRGVNTVIGPQTHSPGS